jgi:RNA polymerase sigma factor (sigma-70 family)
MEVLREPRTPAAVAVFDRLFQARVWRLVNAVASARQAESGDGRSFTTEDREDVFQHTMAFIISGLRYQPVRKRYSKKASRLKVWLSRGLKDGRLIGFISEVTVNYTKDLFRGMRLVRFRAMEVTHTASTSVDGDEPRLVEVQPAEEFDVDFTERAELRAWIRQCVDGMPEPDRSLLLGVVIGERTQANVAAELGLSEATASRRLRHARTALGQRLHEVNPDWADWFDGRRGLRQEVDSDGS